VDCLNRVRRRGGPWGLDEEKWNCIWANRKEPFSRHQRGRLDQKRKGEKVALLRGRKDQEEVLFLERISVHSIRLCE
jgi:hypothetical protein